MPGSMTTAIDRLRSVRTRVENEDGWNQKHWAIKRPDCGTSYCVAGWVCHDNGDQFEWTNTLFGPRAEVAYYVEGGNVEVYTRARELLGIDDEKADELFDPCNSKEDVLRLIDALIAQKEAEA